MTERLKKVKRKYLELVRNEGKDVKVKDTLKQIYRIKKIIKELELRLNKWS